VPLEFAWSPALEDQSSRSLPEGDSFTKDFLREPSVNRISMRTSGLFLEVNQEPVFLSPVLVGRPVVGSVSSDSGPFEYGIVAGSQGVFSGNVGTALLENVVSLKWTGSERTWSV
jgi:hypothetical protein